MKPMPSAEEISGTESEQFYNILDLLFDSGMEMSVQVIFGRLSPLFVYGASGLAALGTIGGLSWLLKRRQKSKQTFMKGVAIYSYEGVKAIRLVSDLPTPSIQAGDEVLVKVAAASVDPLDLRICYGYGRVVRAHIKRFNQHSYGEFPIILGRECSGIVVETGRRVTSVVKGDSVWVFSPYSWEGLIAEFVVVKEHQLALKPSTLSFEEAASFPYVAIVTWNAVCLQGGIRPNCAEGKRILVHSGNTAYGLLAIQLLKAWGAHVTTTVPTIGLPMSHVLGVDDVIVYSVTDFEEELKKRKKFDVILNTVGTILHQSCVDMCAHGGKVVTIVTTPVISDKYGFILGSLLAFGLQLTSWITKVKHGVISEFWWENFSYDTNVLNFISAMIEEGKVRPVVDELCELKNAVEGFHHVGGRNTIGRTVIRICNL